MQMTPVPFWLMIVSMAMAVLPVWRSPMISSRWPRPIGIIESMALRPVCSGVSTFWRCMTPGATRSVGSDCAVSMGPRSSSCSPSALTTRPTSSSPTGTSAMRPVVRTASPSCRCSYGPRMTAPTPSSRRSSASARTVPLPFGTGHLQQFSGHRSIKAVDTRDAVADRGDHALVGVHHRCLEARNALLEDLSDLVAAYGHQLVVLSLIQASAVWSCL